MGKHRRVRTKRARPPRNQRPSFILKQMQKHVGFGEPPPRDADQQIASVCQGMGLPDLSPESLAVIAQRWGVSRVRYGWRDGKIVLQGPVIMGSFGPDGEIIEEDLEDGSIKVTPASDFEDEDE